ncbi:MAG TPA: hypothetical protein VHX38_30055 [Pseudonocardiaceae bacterium]|jgi:hypothetical protein|nr:hypothetical protein [Pseudonocardiaceae bacterium]
MHLKQTVGVAAALSTGFALALPGVAAADVGGPAFIVMNTSETLPDGVYFRSSASMSSTETATGLGVYAGEQVQLQCYEWGQAVGPYNDTLWYYVTNVSRTTNNGAANQGFLNAHYVHDGQNANQVDAGVPECDPSSSSAQSSGSQSPYPTGNVLDSYSPAATVAWAGAHARDVQPFDAACTWFVSQALWAGGLAKTSA